jgi:hypothetical protein
MLIKAKGAHAELISIGPELIPNPDPIPMQAAIQLASYHS